jgi:hypothetical protein
MSYHDYFVPANTPRLPNGFGTAHAGPGWVAATRSLRAAILAARQVAPIRENPPGDTIAEVVIDHVSEIDLRDRAVLTFILGLLFRRKSNGHNHHLSRRRSHLAGGGSCEDSTMTRTEPAEALERARDNTSHTNYPAIYAGFAAKGIAEADIKPRENVFTFQAWKALGRSVKKGEHGVKVTTFVEKKDRETDKVVSRYPRTTTVFHISQTEPTEVFEARQAARTNGGE